MNREREKRLYRVDVGEIIKKRGDKEEERGEKKEGRSEAEENRVEGSKVHSYLCWEFFPP